MLIISQIGRENNFSAEICKLTMSALAIGKVFYHFKTTSWPVLPDS